MSNLQSLCIIAANGLGDALVQMVLANNLARAGFKVIFFSDIAASLNKKVAAYEIKKYPSYAELQETLNSFDIALYDSSGKYVRGMPQECEHWCIENAICYRMSDAQPRHQSITVEDIAQRLNEPNEAWAIQLKGLNRALRGRYSGLDRPPVIVQLTDCLKALGFEKVTQENGLIVKSRKINQKKIILHPTSSNQRKNWPIKKYHTVFKRLCDEGFQPVITVSPAEREPFVNVFGKANVPCFESIADLAEFYADARLFVGSDSGNAHLASSLGIPTIQLFRGYRSSPPWRAGWGKNIVMTAYFPLNLIKPLWHYGITTTEVIKQIKSLT